MALLSKFFKQKNLNRYFTVDVLRGMSLILMIIFHFGFDLTAFGYTHYDTNNDIEWRIFRAIIVSGFLLAVGMSSYLAYGKRIKLSKLAVAIARLVLVAGFISLSSYLMYPQYWVYFGIIHFIAVALLLSLLFLHVPRIALIVGLSLIVGYFTDVITMAEAWRWSVNHLGIPSKTMDLVSIVPWFGVVLIGIFVISYRLVPNIKVNGFTQFVSRMGQHSLLIYLLHQPFLYLCFYIFAWLHQ